MGGTPQARSPAEIAIQTLDGRTRTRHARRRRRSARAVVAANHAIIRAAREGIGRARAWAPPCTAAMLSGNERLVIAQVGDSRAYLLHEGTPAAASPATIQPHGRLHRSQARSRPKKRASHPQRSVITRALGQRPVAPYPIIYEMNVSAGDRLLLCSDGLSGMVDDSETGRAS